MFTIGLIVGLAFGALAGFTLAALLMAGPR